MNKRIYKIIQISGFSLVEMAVVIFIVGILLSAGLKLLSAKVNSAQIEVTRTHQESIKQALISYLGRNKRLPCPTNVANGTLPAPLPPCNITGIIPYAELGLDLSTALDGWENYFTYAISPSLITSPLPPKTPPYTTSWHYRYNPNSNIPPNTSNSTLAFWPTNSIGGISVSDGANVISNPSLATGAVVALLSYGKNGYGAFNVKLGTNDFTEAGVDELQNINPVNAPGNILIIKRDTTDSNAAGGVFDDVVLTLNASELISPLVLSGSVSENTSLSLSKANDFIVGTVIASKDCLAPCNATAPEYYYSIPDPNSIALTQFDPGVTYQRSITDISSINPATSSNIAYALIAGDGTKNEITVGQLRGLLARGSGFN